MTHLHWPLEDLWEQLLPLCSGLSLEAVAEAGSTNTVLLERARRGDASPCLLVAEHQTAGRGRQGRSWASAPGDSLTFSLGLPLRPAQWQGLSLAVGVAVAGALPPGVVLKWPNDLWLAGEAPRKLGGILIETTSVAGDAQSAAGGAGAGTPTAARYTVVGIGLNLAAPASPDARNTAAGLRELDPSLTAPAVLARIAPPLLQALLCFEAEGFAPFAAAYADRDVLRGRPVQVTGPRGEVRLTGEAAGVGPQGALLVHTAGAMHEIESGEVSVRPC